MYCPYCGTLNDDNNFRCTKCGQIIQRIAAPVAVADSTEGAVMRMLLPVGRSGLAIAAGYAGLFALMVWPAPIALVLGILAVRDLKAHPDKLGMGRATFGIVVGALGSAALIWFLVVLALHGWQVAQVWP